MKKIILLLFIAAAPLLWNSCGSNTDADTLKLTVASRTDQCVGVAPMTCFYVKTADNSDWELFYDTIEGFDWEEGHEYLLKVERTRVEDPPMDASAFKYRLIKVLSDEIKTSEGLPMRTMTN